MACCVGRLLELATHRSADFLANSREFGCARAGFCQCCVPRYEYMLIDDPNSHQVASLDDWPPLCPDFVVHDNDQIDIEATVALLTECQPSGNFISIATGLAGMSDALVTPSQRIAIAAQLERADAWLQALKQPNLASLADAAGTKQRDAGQYEDIVLELAFELRWSEYMAGDRMQCAAELRRLPLTWLALAKDRSATARPGRSPSVRGSFSPARTAPSSTGGRAT